MLLSTPSEMQRLINATTNSVWIRRMRNPNLIRQATIRLQQWLNFVLNTNLSTDGIFGPLTKSALQNFQQNQGLSVDGIFGPASFAALRNSVLSKKNPNNVLGLVRYGADLISNRQGFASFQFPASYGSDYLGFKQDCEEHGIKVTSAGSFRAANISAGLGQSRTSLHYFGGAFDLSLDSGMNNPQNEQRDEYVIEPLAGRRWRVWARVRNEAAPKAPKQVTTIKNPATYAQRQGTGRSVTGLFVDFTSLAAKHNWLGIPAWGNYLSSPSPMVLEWWHFQNEFLLFPCYTTFAMELSLIYSQAEINRKPIFNNAQNLVWRDNWHG